MLFKERCSFCGRTLEALIHHPNTADACKNACDCVREADPTEGHPEFFEECPNCLAAAYLEREHYIVCLHCRFFFVKWLPATLEQQLEWHEEDE